MRHLYALSRGLIGAATGLVLGLSLGAAVLAIAQGTPLLPPTVSVDAQLEQAQRLNLQLRKANAQAEYTAATCQEQLLDATKKVAEMEAKSKVVEKKP
jgi:hypothetical protein